MIKINIKQKDKLSLFKKARDSKLIVKIKGEKERVKQIYEAIEKAIGDVK